MRGLLALLATAALAAGCGPDGPKYAESSKVVENASDPGGLWPVLIQHCLKSPSCDPMSDFGQGAGQSSGAIDYVTYFVESADVVKEGGRDYGGAVTMNLYAPRGEGGKAGRPLTLSEAPDNLRANNARRSTLSIEFRTPAGGPPEPYFLSFRSAQIRLNVPRTSAPLTRNDIVRQTSEHVSGLKWPSGEEGAKVEIYGKPGVMFAGYSTGMEVGEQMKLSEALRRGFEPWTFHVSRNLRDEPLPELMAAIEAGESLYVKVSAPDGGVMLSDAIRVKGYGEALREGSEALKDPELAKPIAARCAPFEKEPQEFWKMADVTAALRVCDPRTPQQRFRDGRDP
jgi:hypothetical protein